MPIRLCLTIALALLFPTLAGAEEVTQEGVIDVFNHGGKVMWVILAVSVVGCSFILERFLALRRGRQIPKALMEDLRDAMVRGGVVAGRQVVAGESSALARVMHALLSRSGATRRELEGVLDDEAGRILADLRHNLRPIGVLASVAPLLGLLGTVFGLIAAFRSAAELGMDDPRNFAAGIYEALYTTAFGLVVAIPLLLVYHVLRNRTDSLMREVERRALDFITVASLRSENSRGSRKSPAADAAPRASDSQSNLSDSLAASEDTNVDDPE
ncbi:MAG: MotA/TolQ/ExbB proton channel family protein [Planctomycetota bacterium]|nr:MotA/TolQ/ExbB proton channel family protein [Planctomycetota bacterium]